MLRRQPSRHRLSTVRGASRAAQRVAPDRDPDCRLTWKPQPGRATAFLESTATCATVGQARRGDHAVKIKSQKDFWSGVMFVVMGVAFAWGATNYTFGSSARPGDRKSVV